MDAIIITEDHSLTHQIENWCEHHYVSLQQFSTSSFASNEITCECLAKRSPDLLIIDLRDSFLQISGDELANIRSLVSNDNPHLYILYFIDEIDPEYWLNAHEYDYRILMPAPTGKLDAKLNSILTNYRVMHELKSQVLLMETLFDRSRDGIAISDKNGNLLITNHQLNSLFGYQNHGLDGKNVSELLPPPYNEHFRQYLSKFSSTLEEYKQGHKFVEEGEGLDIHGRIIPVELSITELPGLNEMRYLAVIRDIRQKSADKRALSKATQYDALTQLPGRELLLSRLTKRINQWDINKISQAPCLLLMNINRFKTINESLGHKEGDQLLVELVRRIRFQLSEQDTLYRVANDEFAVVLKQDITETEIDCLTGQILDDLATPFFVGTLDLYVSLTFGIAKANQDTDSGEHLLQYASKALMQAKENSQAINYYVSETTSSNTYRLELESSLFKALENNEFELYYQPQVSLKSNQIIGAEALLRWSDSRHGAISPIEFVPILEDTGLIDKVGSWVINKSCAYWKFWQDEGLIRDNQKLSVNVSPYQFRNTGLLVSVKTALEETGLNPENLILEITESTLLADDENNLAILNSLKSLGVTVALDDFGTGFSSLSYLTRFPIDYLKIDRAFLINIMESTNDAHLVTAIINMAHGLEMKVIAEGVDSLEKLNFLQQKGCDNYQGFYFSRPVTGNEFIRILNQTGHMEAC
ncbi:putative bifunctional diguanylate cyclase/phosphodiesterase [Litoribrevibacter euphylliae]|uniref:Bifunctional diguanylate cyclase/phosphodiesterase n=1 Tax=Litoribrevibacter euphylliae TaxID=1834034 RepID=A0ABV7H6X7_9GAMM